MMFVSAHFGAGKMMQNELDPSLVDEADLYSCDPSLDMYNPDTAFASRRSQAAIPSFLDPVPRRPDSTGRTH